MKILSTLMNVNGVYIILCIVGFIASFLYLYTKNKRRIIPLFILLYILIIILSFRYFDYVFNSVFRFNYSGVKFYLIVLIITNVIALITINCNVSLLNKIINYVLFITSSILFIINVFLVINSSLNIFDIEINALIYLIDLDIIIFISYLIINCVIYIGKKVGIEIKNYFERLNYKKTRENVISYEEESEIQKNKIIDSKNEIVKEPIIINENDKFIIDGKDCSFIFNDPNRENVIKNYYILLTDVNARLVNGYTIDENIRIHNILNRLNIKNIHNLDLMNMEILSKMSIEEYNLLKSYLDNCKML